MYMQYLLSNVGSCPEENNVNRTLSSFSLERKRVAGDGDCLFTSIAIHTLLQMNTHPGSTISNHLYNIGFNGLHSTTSTALLLRQLVSDEFVNNPDVYMTYFPHNTDDDIENYFEMASEFRQAGIYNSDIGDAALLAISNVISTPVIVFSTVPYHTIIPVLPSRPAIHPAPFVHIIYNHASEHYDASCPYSQY